MKRFPWVTDSIIALLFLGSGIFVSQFNWSAVPEPGQRETYLATKAKHFLVRRGSRTGIPPAPSDLQASVAEGDKLFGTECGACHGLSGNKATDAGRWMYPRAAELPSSDAKGYPDRGLFGVVRDGTRLRGVALFGRGGSDGQRWYLVDNDGTIPSNVQSHAQ